MTSSADESASWTRPWQGPPRVPHTALDEDARRASSLPATLLPAPDGMNHPLVFEPALKHFAHAYRAGEPHFGAGEEATGRAWHRARRTVLDTVLASVADGPWGDHLVLRGSVLMATWFGEAARDPGDLDFLVVPREWALDDPGSPVSSSRSPGTRQPPPTGAPYGSTRRAWSRRTSGRTSAFRADGCSCRGRRTGHPATPFSSMWCSTRSFPPPPHSPNSNRWATDRAAECRPSPRTLPGLEAAVAGHRPVSAGQGSVRCRAARGTHGAELRVGAGGVRSRWDRGSAAPRALAGGRDGRTGRLGALHRRTPVGHGEGGRVWRTSRAGAGTAAGDGDPDRGGGQVPAVGPVAATAGGVHTRDGPGHPAAALGQLADGGRDGLKAAVVVVREIVGAGSHGLADTLADVLSHEGSWQYWRDHPEACARVLDELR